MKVIHIESGLGNQMLSYCEYLAVKQANPNDECYIETIVFDIPECNDVICQWNGYELKNIFGIDAPNICTRFSDEQWSDIMESVRKSRFWEKNWNWPVYLCKAFAKEGLNLKNCRGNFEKDNEILLKKKRIKIFAPEKIKQSGAYEYIRHLYKKTSKKSAYANDADNLFLKSEEDCLNGQRLTFKLNDNQIERIDKEIRESFQFPELTDEKNIALSKQLKSCESVAIHARRGDMLSANGKYYKSGYFKRAVKHIKKNVKNPVFYFFCDPGSIEWCRENPKIFGLDFASDNVHFVDWNKGTESYRDMQLMSMCSHNIITNSTFGWWGAYFNTNPDKITISPEIEINTTYHC